MRPRGPGTRERQTACSVEAGRPRFSRFWGLLSVNTVSEAGVRTGAGVEVRRTGRPRSYAERAARPTASARKTLAKSSAIDSAETARQVECNATCLALLAHVEPWFRSTPVKQKNNRRRARRRRCAHSSAQTHTARRRIGSRAKLTVSDWRHRATRAIPKSIITSDENVGPSSSVQLAIRHDDIRRLEVARITGADVSRHCKTGAWSSPTHV